MSVFAALVLTAPGCVELGDDELGPELSETSQEISMAGGAVWGSSSNTTAPLMLGNTSQETCFLSGITGQLVGNPLISGIQGFNPASVEVYPHNGKWWVTTRAGVGHGAMAWVTCVNVPYPGPSNELSWSDGLTSSGLPDAPNRRCFLRKVWATSGLDGSYFVNKQTNLTVKKTNGTWHFNDSYVYKGGGDKYYGGATAVCLDVPLTASWTFTHVGPTNSTNNASSTITLRNYYPDGPGVPITNVACGLTGIAGRWSASWAPMAWSNGVTLVRDPAVSPFWRLTATNGRTGHVSCIK